jgi:hypothetical protein
VKVQCEIASKQALNTVVDPASGLHEVHEALVGHRNLAAYFPLGTRDDNALEAINSYLPCAANGRKVLPH